MHYCTLRQAISGTATNEDVHNLSCSGGAVSFGESVEAKAFSGSVDGEACHTIPAKRLMNDYI